MLSELDRLRTVLAEYRRLVVAFSGGVDSALLAFVANEVLGRENVLCATAVSASLDDEARADCVALAKEWELRHVEIETHETDDPAYIANDLDRCYHCKAELMTALAPLAAADDAVVALGVNLDDLGEHRPGQSAARAQGAVFPLVGAGLSKTAVRELSLRLGLRTFDKPANACLASRVPHGTPVTLGVLSRVARAESALRRLGFGQLRVRHYGDSARIELTEEEIAAAVEARHDIVAALKAAGYSYVTLDLEGFRSGNLAAAALGEAGVRQ
jgi:uncharacterized protein